ncbi:MAG: T9SS type A sorting domain-containing protein, partial [Sphingobacteriaceae bacterium]
CITDVSGNVYMTGETGSNTNIATVGAHQTAFGGGSNDAFLVKFNSAGVRQWGTYYGGTGDDYGISCISDASGNVYVSGITNSNTNIANVGSHQATFGGGTLDAYLVKFNSAGVRQWGTYYGGSGNDFGWICITDASGNVYMAGGTNSNTNIATAGTHQTTFGGGSNDAFLVKFNSAGVRQWGTYYGGTGVDFGYSCSNDATGNVYMSGDTDSNTNIATAGAHQTTFGGATEDAFLVKFSQCVAINPIATVNATVCSGAALNFTASISGTITPTYSWSGPNSFTSNIQNPSITNAGTVNIGVYTLTVNNGGCVETTTTQVSSVSACTGINQLVSNSSDYNFLVYPNPSKGVFNIACKDTDPNSLKVIEVIDALGRVLISEKVYKAAYELNLTNYVNGIYFIKIIENGKTKTVKVVKE